MIAVSGPNTTGDWYTHGDVFIHHMYWDDYKYNEVTYTNIYTYALMFLMVIIK